MTFIIKGRSFCLFPEGCKMPSFQRSIFSLICKGLAPKLVLITGVVVV